MASAEVTIPLCRHNNLVFVQGQRRDSVSSLIHFSLSLPPFIYCDLKSQMAFSVFFPPPSVSVRPSLVQPFSPTRPLSFQKLFEVSWLSTSLVLSGRRTRCNFLLISSSPPLRKRALLPADGGRERGGGWRRRGGREKKEAGRGTGSWPVTAPNQASLLTLLSLSPFFSPSLVLFAPSSSLYLVRST